MNKKAKRKVPDEISVAEIKIRKRYAPVAKTILSAKDKKPKHKEKFDHEEE